MSQKLELPLDTQCFLCDSYYSQIHSIFVVYKCFMCMKFTPYCLSCELKLQRLFGKGNFFKCMICDKLTNALDKIEVTPCNNNINNNSFYKTPSKPFMENNIPISSIRHNGTSNFLINFNKDEEEKKDNNTDKIMISNFLNDFNKININLALNKKSNNDLGNSSLINTSRNNIPDISKVGQTLVNSSNLSTFKKDNDYSLLKSRSRLNKRLCLNESLLGRKRDDSENNIKLNRHNRSRGKFKNLISMKMSKVYNKEDRENAVDEYQKKNSEIKNVFLSSNNESINNGLGFGLLSERNKNNNLFSNNQRGMDFNYIDGKSTPHRISNNSFEYF